MTSNMITGKTYLLFNPGYSFEDEGGNTVEFKEKRITVEVLPKPCMVTVCDGESEAVEPTPDHLKKDCWHLVRNIKTKAVHWLNDSSFEIVEAPSAD